MIAASLANDRWLLNPKFRTHKKHRVMEIVLNTFGTSLNRDNECFVVSNDQGRQRVPPESVSSITLCRGVSITSDAVLLAISHGIEIRFVDRRGMPQGLVWSHRYGSISTIRKGQLEFTASPAAVEWIKGVIVKKLENQQALLLMLGSDSHVVRAAADHAIAHIEALRLKAEALAGDRVADVAGMLRGIEGAASRAYFAAFNAALPAAYRFAERSQHPAADVANALLNYGYGILYGRVEASLIKSGIDPYIGVMHRDDYNRPVLVYDVIELYRVWVDYVVAALLCQNAVTDDYYSTAPDGSCWLEGLGRRVLIQSVNDYLAELTVTDGGMSRSRATAIDLYAQQLAQRFKAAAGSSPKK